MPGTHVRRQLPFAILATVVVVVLPALVLAALPGSPGALVGIPLCVVLSLAFARAAAALWRRSPRSREVLFADLMLWGWARRVATERRLERARSLVEEPTGDADKRVRALERVSEMLESRDAYTRRHSLRVTRYSEAIARELGLPAEEVAMVRQAAALHDVGKFFTPREVLNKPGRLSEEEFAVIKLHPGQGADMLRGVVEPEVVAMIRHHHERLGGRGYPDGLAGDDIPLGARIIAVADTFDAMTSTRAYRSARPHATALAVLREEAGVALDARAVAAFEAVYSGRRGTAWSSVASGMTQTLAPLRELLLPAARALPALGASAALTAPVLVGGGPASAAPVPRDDGPRQARSVAARPASASAAVERLARRFDASARRVADGRGAPGRARTDAGREDAPDRLTPPPSGPQDGSGTGGGPGDGATPGGSAAPAPTTAPAQSEPAPHSAADAPVATSAPTVAPAPSAAPTSAPEVTTPSVQVGDIEVPAIEVDVPDLPVDLPVDIPTVKLPPIKLP